MKSTDCLTSTSGGISNRYAQKTARWSAKNIQKVKRRVRSQCLETLRLAGQWAKDEPRGGSKTPVTMRAMLVANLHVPARFANGAQGRVLHWEPNAGERARGIPAKDERILVKFCHEAPLGQRVKMPGIDKIDVTPRQESAPHQSTLLQVPIAPAYALCIHKVQSLTMGQGKVLGCLEGVFAHGQLYVLVSRVADPENFCLVGLPPKDLLDDVARAWEAKGSRWRGRPSERRSPMRPPRRTSARVSRHPSQPRWPWPHLRRI